MLRLHPHDPFQLELKHEIPLASGAPHTLDLWMWLPSQLGVGANGFRREDFYEDRTAYVRFHAPPLEAGAIEDRETGPLADVWAHAQPGRRSDAESRKRAIRALRVYATVYRATQRERARAALPGPEGKARRDRARACVADGTRMLAQWREAQRAWLPGDLPEDDFARVVRAVEDFLSMQSIEAWYTLHGAWDDETLRADLAEAIRRETALRAAGGHQGALDPADTAANERFVTRINVLKKFVLGVLHVRLRTDKRAEHVRDMLFALSAAVAMFVALVLQIWTTWAVGMPNGPGPALIVFVAAGVGGYILKDRTKEWLKGWFTAKLPSWLHDRRVLLLAEGESPMRRWKRFSAAGLRPIGAVEETVRLVEPHEVPREIAALRSAGEDVLTQGERANEDVLHYRRRTHTDPAGAPPSMVELDAIVRVAVHRWLRRMDDPARTLFQVQPDGSVLRLKAPRTYRAHVVARTHETCVHAVVVLTRKGITRVDILSS